MNEKDPEKGSMDLDIERILRFLEAQKQQLAEQLYSERKKRISWVLCKKENFKQARKIIEKYNSDLASGIGSSRL